MVIEGLIESKRHKMEKGRMALLPVVIGIHIIVLAALVVSSVWQISYLQEAPINVALYASAPPPPPAAAAKKVQQQQTQAQQTQTQSNVAPISIPDFAPQVLEASSDSNNGSDYGVEGGVDYGGVAGGVLGGMPALPGDIPRPPAAEDNTPVIVGGDVQAPIRQTELVPIYTEPARKARIEGIVILQLTIDKQGSVVDVKVLRGLAMGLTDAAIEAARRQHFKPAYRASTGRPVDCLYTITVQFKIQ